MTHYCYLVLPRFQPSPKAVTFVGMKIQMHLITLFVTLSILGIFFFQGYWLWNQYTMESRQMHERIDLLFKQSIAEVLAIQVEDMGRDTSATARHGTLEIGISADSLSRAQSQPTSSTLLPQYDIQSGRREQRCPTGLYQRILQGKLRRLAPGRNSRYLRDGQYPEADTDQPD